MERRINVEVQNANESVAGHMIQSAMKTGEGTYKGVITLDDSDDMEYIEEMLDADENVVKYYK